ncbi:DASS family sodium-coupled anion symporter [Campylobacter sp. RM9333]|uniref:DASS family sodium-coupled anion symporter n=1 Tax=Campylobacter sp. RM9333 TaxID=2735731 RepID=UPI001D76240F|nr:DASS family sodium-coupled anion symporter [Campylobacter sp. RM9333]
MKGKVPLWKFIAPVAAGLLVFLLSYLFADYSQLSMNAWIYVSIFAALVVGLILEPMPPAFLGIIAIALAILFKVGPAKSGEVGAKITSEAAINWGLTGFSNSVVWLIFASFMIGIGYQNSGLGKRIALILVNKLGKSTLGLGYAIAIADLILAPFIPSNAARSGGTIYPIATSIPAMYDSSPDKEPRKIGAYIAWVSLATTCISSSIFLTGQAPNPLALEILSKSGIAVVDWMGWFLCFLPIGIILFLITPLLTYYIYPPEVKGSSKISAWAKEELVKLGSIKLKELLMLSISILALILWIGSKTFGVSATTTALIVIILMIVTNIITWNDFLANKPAWNVLTWFATLVTMAGGLKNVGFLEFLSKYTDSLLSGISPTLAVFILLLVFCLLRYFFASGTAYVTAVVGVFAIIASKIAGYDASFIMMFLLAPMGMISVLTPYGTGHSPIWFASGYIKGAEFWKLGAIFGAIYLLIYTLIAYPWFKFIIPHIFS